METKSRRTNLSTAQILKLISLVGTHMKTICGRHQGAAGYQEISNKSKKATWEKIMLEVNAIDPLSPHRTADELRKKWNDLRHHTIKYRTRLAGTGGGPPPKKPTFYDEVMDVIEEKKTLLCGIPDTNDIPSLGWQEVVASSVIIPDPFEEDIVMEHVPLMASSPLAIEHAEEPQNAANAQDGQSEISNDMPHKEKENGPSPGPSKVCHTHRPSKRKQKSNKSVTGDEPWEEYLRGMISLNKVRERVALLQEIKLKKEIKKLDRELGK